MYTYIWAFIPFFRTTYIYVYIHIHTCIHGLHNRSGSYTKHTISSIRETEKNGLCSSLSSDKNSKSTPRQGPCKHVVCVFPRDIVRLSTGSNLMHFVRQNTRHRTTLSVLLQYKYSGKRLVCAPCATAPSTRPRSPSSSLRASPVLCAQRPRALLTPVLPPRVPSRFAWPPPAAS